MTPQYAHNQNRMKLIVFFVFIVMLLVTGFLLKGRYENNANAASPGKSESRMFLGIKRVPPKEIQALLPELKGKPGVIEFHSKLCHDCKRVTPLMEKLVAACPGVVFKKFDILEDRKKAPAVFKSFNPVSVPILVFVDKKGKIQDVLYNNHTQAELAESLDSVKPSACAVKG